MENRVKVTTMHNLPFECDHSIDTSILLFFLGARLSIGFVLRSDQLIETWIDDLD